MYVKPLFLASNVPDLHGRPCETEVHVGPQTQAIQEPVKGPIQKPIKGPIRWSVPVSSKT